VEYSATMSVITSWWESQMENQQQVDAKRRQDSLYYFQAAVVQ
jgi:hypothetical protein